MTSINTNAMQISKQDNESLDAYIERLRMMQPDWLHRDAPEAPAERLKSLAEALKQSYPLLTQIEVDYSGGGDSGSIDSVSFHPGLDAMPGQAVTDHDALDRLIDGLAWDIAYGQNPGFEINEGGQGTVTCAVVDGEWTVSLHHEENFIQTNEYKYTF